MNLDLDKLEALARAASECTCDHGGSSPGYPTTSVKHCRVHGRDALDDDAMGCETATVVLDLVKELRAARAHLAGSPDAVCDRCGRHVWTQGAAGEPCGIPPCEGTLVARGPVVLRERRVVRARLYCDRCGWTLDATAGDEGRPCARCCGGTLWRRR